MKKIRFISITHYRRSKKKGKASFSQTLCPLCGQPLGSLGEVKNPSINHLIDQLKEHTHELGKQ
jgi:hypothetical protein